MTQVSRKTPPGPGSSVPVPVICSHLPGSRRRSVRGFPVQVSAGDSFQYLPGRLDLRPWRLEDGVGPGLCPRRERRAEVCVARLFGGDHQALPLGQLVGELAVPGGQVADPLGCLLRVVFGGGGRAAGLGCGGRRQLN